MAEIKRALKSLGYREGASVRVYGRMDGRMFVIVNGVLIGVYDMEKKTFVD